MSNKSDEKAEKSDTQVMADAIAKGIADGMTMAKVAELEAAKNAQMASRARTNRAKCPKCGQSMKACGGPEAGVDMKKEDKNHVKMVVLPDDPEDIRFFQGLRLNGKVYLSNSHNHYLLVPRKNDFAWQLANYCRNERDQRRGRKATHNSGSIGGRNAKGFKPATAGWR